MGVKYSSNVHSNQDFPRTGDHSWVGHFPNQYGFPVWKKYIKSEMLSLARTSQYMNNNSVVSINMSEDDS